MGVSIEGKQRISLREDEAASAIFAAKPYL
jgi:hypothetical protein